MTDSPAFSHVHIIGTGLLGTSIGMAISSHGGAVSLEDLSPARASLAAEYGAGTTEAASASTELVVVATPPDVAASVVQNALERFPDAVVIDVASIKAPIVDAVASAGHERFLGTHPMAGREKGGPTQARSDLFVGRPWVVCPTPETPSDLLGRVEELIRLLGATVYRMDASEHDHAVAVVSHLPQLVSSALSATLDSAPDQALELAGQGLRDMTRIAASDAELWSQILQHNAPAVRAELAALRARLERVDRALWNASEQGVRRELAEELEAGVAGVARIPGKHGRSDRFTTITVVIDDRPGQLASLLSDVGDLGVNLEDMGLEHSPGAPVGFVSLSVLPSAAAGLVSDLVDRGWRVAGETS